MPLDIALSYDPAARRCDLVFDGTDFVLDSTPVTPVLVSLLTDGRAATDDVLPAPSGPFAAPTTLLARRGFPGDALDRAARRMGSRLWLLRNAMHTEDTRRRAETYAAEALEGLEDELGITIALTVAWVARNRLRILVQCGARTITVFQQVGA